MSDEDERRLGVGDEDEIIREEESGGDEEMDVDESDYSPENNESEEIIREEESGGDEGMDEDDESDYSPENNESEVNVGESVSRIEEDTIDRLSVLPDSLLICILAGLNMKKAITTCVLSKRWQYLWTQLPRLHFSESSEEIAKARKLVSWVHRALVLHSVNYLDELHIDFMYYKRFASDINTWVEFTVRNKVKELRLELHSSLDLFDMLPQSMYSCSSLTLLSVRGCIVAPRVIVDWKCLTDLTLVDVELHEHTIQLILSGCPVLSSLDLIVCWGFERLEVNSQSLYELVVSGCDEGILNLLEISAPYIRSLSISLFDIGKKALRLTNIPSLIKATIDFNVVESNHITEMEMDDAVRFFEDIKHVKELELNCQCLELLSKLAENNGQLPKSTREHLIVYRFRDLETVSAILLLLASSPNLETLSVHSYDGSQPPDRTWDPIESEDLDCDLLRLKTVHLMDCADPNLDGEPMLTIARILLKRATALEKMVVGAWGNLNDSSSSCLEIVQELLSYPRSSQKAVIDLRQ